MNESAPYNPTLQVVSFMAGGYRFAVEASWVRTQLSATEADAAINVEALLGLHEREDSENKRILVIRHPTADYPILVSDPVTLCELSLNDLHPLPDMLAVRCTLNGIRALSTDSEGITILIDFNAINPASLAA